MASRLVRVTDPDFDAQGWETQFGADYVHEIEKNYYKYTLEIMSSADELKHPSLPLPDTSNPAFRWTPMWYFASSLFITNAIHNTVLKKDIPNFVHPHLRRAAKPIAVATVAASMVNTTWLCTCAQLDDRTSNYQTAATGVWQLANNIALPLFTFRALSMFLPSTTKAVYGTALGCLALPIIFGGKTKFFIEGLFMNRRFSRKDYGSHGHATDLESLIIDTPLQQLEQIFNTQGSEHVINASEESKNSFLFPMFSLAEALPTHEVPFHGGQFAMLQPLPVIGTILQLSMETEVNGKERAIPAPTIGSMDRFSSRYGDWSIATPHQAAADMMAVPFLRQTVLRALVPTPLTTSHQKLRDESSE